MDKMTKSKVELFIDNYFEFSSQQFVLTEQATKGKAEIVVKVNKPALYIGRFDSKPKCGFLKSNKCADHVILVHNEANLWELHVIEIKKSVGYQTWLHGIKPQTKMALLHSLAIAGCLEIRIDKIVCYTAYENDKFTIHSTDLVDFKGPLGEWRPNSLEEWNTGIVNIKLGEWRKFDHKKIKMHRDGATHIMKATFEI